MNQRLSLIALAGILSSVSSLPAYATPMGTINPYDRANGEMNVAPLLQQRAPSTGQGAPDGQFSSNFYKTPPNMKQAVSTEGFWEKDAPLFPKLDPKGLTSNGQMDPETAHFLKSLQAFLAENDKQVRALGITVSARKPTGMDRSPFAKDGMDSLALLAPSKESPRHIPDPVSLANSADSSVSSRSIDSLDSSAL